MCGICGLYSLKDKVSSERVLMMTKSLFHRGPDNFDIYLGDNIGLGHTRLSIIDLSRLGNQPMVSDDNRYILTYNGEIYNYKDIKSELISLGYRFKSSSDSEVVLNSYIQWGGDCFAKFNGMFSLAIFDSFNQELILVRDRFGIKPLYYSNYKDEWFFASEIKSILAGGMKVEENWAAIHEFLYYGNSLGKHTSFRNINSIMPGQIISISKKGISERYYNDILAINECNDPYDLAVERVRELLKASVKKQLISDVPVGVFLSGGIDSSAIAAFASQEQKVNTFTAGFDFSSAETDERSLSRKFANKIGSNHTEIEVRGGDLVSTIENLVKHHDLPFGDAANIPLYLMTKELNGQSKVILQGDGGDEIFGGYFRYSRLNFSKFMSIGAKISKYVQPFIHSRSDLYRKVDSIKAYGHASDAMKMALIMSQEEHDFNPTQMFSYDFSNIMKNHNPFDRYFEISGHIKTSNLVQKMLYTDMNIILPDKYFQKVDRATMAHGIEARVPMLDNELVAYLMSLPSRYKVKGLSKKHLLKDALRGILPNDILYGRKKGFEVPFKHWLREPLKKYLTETLLDGSIAQCGWISISKTEKCIKDHISKKRDYGYLLWKMLNLALWHRFYFEDKVKI